ncbi:hypothetical protein AAFF_G00017710 [Aldrovandia affinis]|uniref:Uncharacterized protein n=1 Tax=Aldrovandia affinis TaxID=143900 RepID=A0AAD7WH63_9TELE|nr:hypothetical protein AAFF_G00017710 [Aldrovandia affinis]
MLQRWNIDKTRVHVVLRDNARNMAKAMTDGNLASLPCLAHTLQLAVHEGLLSQRSINDVTANARKIVGHFKHSPLAYSRLHDIQDNMGQGRKRLQQDVPTRWNSTYYMLESLIEQRRALGAYGAEHELPATLSAYQWGLIGAQVPGCHFHGQKLDRHLVGIHIQLSQKRRQAYSDRAKEAAIDQLGKLRASDPVIPMVSQLDLQASEGGSLPQVTSAEQDTAEVQGEAGPSTIGKKRTMADRRAEEEADETGGPQQEVATEIEEEAGPRPVKRKKKFQEGVEPTDKQQENVTSKICRIKAFLEYMSTDHTDLWTWNFLCQPQRILEWARHVQKGGIQVTTTRFYMINICNFVDYMKETPPKHSRLNMPKLTVVSRTIRQALLTMSWKVVAKDTLNKCQELSKCKMPELLEDIKTQPRGEPTQDEQAVWGSPDLPGAYGIQNHQVNDPEVRKMVAEYMCHDLTTQNHFYALHHGIQEAKKLRQVFVVISTAEIKDKKGG